MLSRDILLHDVNVDAQRNPIKNIAAKKRAQVNQHIKNFIIIFFTYILMFFDQLFTLSFVIFFPL